MEGADATTARAGRPAVVGIGWVVQDSIMLLDSFPPEDVKVQASRTLDQVGGPVPRALSVLARLGVGVSLAAVVGSDAAGAACREALRKRGIDVSEVAAGPGPTRRAHVWLSEATGSRTIAYRDEPGIGALAPGPPLAARVRAASALHSDGRELQAAIALAEVARQEGVGVVVDAGGWKPGLEALLDLATVLVVSEQVAGELGGRQPVRTAGGLLARHPPLEAVLLTAGARGTTVVTAASTAHVPAVPVEPVDTNGAGDAFCGGLLFGLVTGQDLVTGVRFASHVAALCVSHFGDYFPDLKEVEESMRSAGAGAG